MWRGRVDGGREKRNGGGAQRPQKKVEVCLHVINDCGDKNVNYQWQRPGCVLADFSWGVNIQTEISEDLFYYAQGDGIMDIPISIPIMLQFLGAFKICRGRAKRGKRFCWLKTVWAVLSSREGKETRDSCLEGMFGSSDLQRSKSCPLTFVLCAASCSAQIKLCKHPNHEATSAHINPTSFLLPILSTV